MELADCGHSIGEQGSAVKVGMVAGQLVGVHGRALTADVGEVVAQVVERCAIEPSSLPNLERATDAATPTPPASLWIRTRQCRTNASVCGVSARLRSLRGGAASLER